MGSPFRKLSVVLVAAFVLLTRDATCCSCFGPWFTLRTMIRKAPFVATAEVMVQGRLRRQRLYPDLDVAYLDVRIVKKLRGREERHQVRVWDAEFGTSCSGDLRPFLPGTYIAFAAAHASSDAKEYLSLLEIEPSSDDYLLGGSGACGPHYEKLESVEAARAFPKDSKPGTRR